MTEPPPTAATGAAVRLVLRAEPPGTAHARRLTGALDAFLGSLYPPDENFLALPDSDVSQDRGTFLVGWAGGRAIACGAIRLISGSTGEVKRMWVDPAGRGFGHGRALLAELERWAVGRGAERVVLETGDLQVEALNLYRSSGYREIPCFGEYAASPSSLCFEKRL